MNAATLILVLALMSNATAMLSGPRTQCEDIPTPRHGSLVAKDYGDGTGNNDGSLSDESDIMRTLLPWIFFGICGGGVAASVGSIKADHRGAGRLPGSFRSGPPTAEKTPTNRQFLVGAKNAGVHNSGFVRHLP
jgi:hypothetical protein